MFSFFAKYRRQIEIGLKIAAFVASVVIESVLQICQYIDKQQQPA